MRIHFIVPMLALTACMAAEEGEPVVGNQTPAASSDYATQLTPPPHPEVVDTRLGYDAPRRPSTAQFNGSDAEAQRIGKMWFDRLGDAAYGFATQTINQDIQLSLRITEAEFDALMAQKGWTLPAYVDVSFVRPLTLPAVSAAAAPKLRAFASSKQRTGIQLEGGGEARIVVRDGCILTQAGQAGEALAWFHAEVGVEVDDKGYLVLIDRRDGHRLGWLGERMGFAVPNPDPDPEGAAALRAACGNLPIYNVGMPRTVAAD
ncbi:hypothetical protein [Sphingomicrobium arenosum]|uniref:hypothetical protein n=1 Tax=Sphingomicrobium arenosum TaxID=2233861 RepID=UPI002240FCA0|nr:hypothetical protein [Sphingomicrobium arenosum]